MKRPATLIYGCLIIAAIGCGVSPERERELVAETIAAMNETAEVLESDLPVAEIDTKLKEISDRSAAKMGYLSEATKEGLASRHQNELMAPTQRVSRAMMRHMKRKMRHIQPNSGFGPSKHFLKVPTQVDPPSQVVLQPQREALEKQRDMVVHHNASVYLMDADGSNLQCYGRVDGYEWHGSPSFSPDGKLITFNAHRAGLKDAAIFFAGVKGTPIHRLCDGSMPIWLDNETLLVCRGGEIRKVRLDGQDLGTLTRGRSPVVSWDRRWLIFTRGSGVIVRNLETDQETPVTTTPRPRAFNGVGISRDGKTFAFVKMQGGGVYVANVSSGKGELVADEPGNGFAKA